jgi:osmotically-inducible protein OsmY
MTSQDYRVQESRYRPDDYADEQRRYDEARRYQSGRRDQQGQAGYGRGRDFGPRDEYGRDADNFGRRWSEPSGHGRYEEEHFGGERSLAERDYYDRGREPRNYGNPELEGYGSRPAGQYQVGGYRGGERDYGVSRNPRLAAYGNDPRDDYAQDNQGVRPRWLSDRGDEWARGAGDYRDEHARYHGVGPKTYKRSDERIREDVSDNLSDDSYIDASDIEVNVHNSEITLSGSVENRIQRRRAELAAEQVSGVSHIQNNLRVKHAGQGAQPASGAADQANAPKIAAQAR